MKIKLPKWKLKNYYFTCIKRGICPCCGIGEFEFVTTESTGILVNIESKGRVEIEDFWIPSEVCDNPMCGWSKVDVTSMNLCSVKDAWKESEVEK